MKTFKKHYNKILPYGGNCGMYAIALGKKLQKQNKKPVMVVFTDAQDLNELMYGEIKVYHIAVEIDKKIYDGEEETTVQKIVDEYAQGIYGDSSPYVYYLKLNNAFIKFVRTQTNCNVNYTEFKI